jgi:hypothetical protein
MLMTGVLALMGGASPVVAQMQATMTSKVAVPAQTPPKITAPTAPVMIKKDPLPAGTYMLSFTTRCPAGTSIGIPPQRVTVTRNGDKIDFSLPVVNMATLNAPGQSPLIYVEGQVQRDGDHNMIWVQGMTWTPTHSAVIQNIFTLRGTTNDYNQSASGAAAIDHCDAYTGAYENTTDQASFTLTPVN